MVCDFLKKRRRALGPRPVSPPGLYSLTQPLSCHGHLDARRASPLFPTRAPRTALASLTASQTL